MARRKVIQTEKSLYKETEIYECQWNICFIIAKGQGSEGGRKSRSGQVIKSDAMLASIDLILSCPPPIFMTYVCM